MLILLVRIGFVILAVVIGLGSGQYFYRSLADSLPGWFGGAMGFGIAITLIAAEHAFRRRFTRSLVAFLIGLGAGLTLAFLTLSVLRLVLQDEDLYRNLDVPIAVIITYLVLITVLRGADRFRLVVPFVEFRSERQDAGSLIVDADVLADGRLIGLMRAGLFSQPILVHRRVLAQCEANAANAEPALAARGRRQLDGLAELRALGRPSVEIDETEIPNATALEDVLTGLARLEGGRLVVGNHDLYRRAVAEGIQALDLNGLAGTFSTPVRAGENLSVLIEKPGEGRGQGIGFLDDGSMIVVAEGADRVGQRVPCTVLRLHATANGRMVFCEIKKG
ncbi:MAG: hypothetical protein H0W72_15735 [Planctomycetes bacterium]|nr:hypothetical protein [Planctomycetota bacterium]